MDIHGRSSASATEEFEEHRQEYREHPQGLIHDVLKNVADDVRTLVRSEIKSAGLELLRTARRARPAVMTLGVGGMLLLSSIGFFSLTVMFALAMVLPYWLSALIVAACLLILSIIGISTGRSRIKSMLPNEVREIAEHRR
jgi:uncharacterized membrane protein YqjE